MLAEFTIKHIEARQIEPPMQRGERCGQVAAGKWQMKAIDVEMNYIEVIRALENALEHRNNAARRAPACNGIEPDGAFANGNELGARGGISAGKQRHVMPLPYQLFG